MGMFGGIFEKIRGTFSTRSVFIVSTVLSVGFAIGSIFFPPLAIPAMIFGSISACAGAKIIFEGFVTGLFKTKSKKKSTSKSGTGVTVTEKVIEQQKGQNVSEQKKGQKKDNTKADKKSHPVNDAAQLEELMRQLQSKPPQVKTPTSKSQSNDFPQCSFGKVKTIPDLGMKPKQCSSLSQSVTQSPSITRSSKKIAGIDIEAGKHNKQTLSRSAKNMSNTERYSLQKGKSLLQQANKSM